MAPITTLRPVAKAVLRTQPDGRLVALVRGCSEDAFAEIVRRYRPGLVRLARSLGSGERSEDVVQDGLVRAWRALRSSDAEIELRPWLTTIVRNRAMSAHASTRDHDELDELDETIDGVARPPDIVIMREELRSTVSAVNALPDSQRDALVRSALRGESHDQIAGALAITPGAVRQLIFRARCGLRAGLGALIPAPVVRQLAELSDAGGSAAAAIAAASAGGGSAVVKGAALVLIGAAVAGSGIALERADRDGVPGGERIAGSAEYGSGDHASDDPAGSSDGGSTSDAIAIREPLDDDDLGGDRGAPSDGSGDGSGGPGSEAEDSSSGPGSGSDDGFSSSGPGSDDDHTSSGARSGESETEPSDSSGPGSESDDSFGELGGESDDGFSSSGPGSDDDHSLSAPGSGESETEPSDSSGSNGSGSSDGSGSSGSDDPLGGLDVPAEPSGSVQPD